VKPGHIRQVCGWRAAGNDRTYHLAILQELWAALRVKLKFGQLMELL